MENKQINKEFIDQIISEISRELKSKYDDFRGIYLFGSYSRNEQHKDSDIDIAILFDREIDREFKDEIIGTIYEFEVKNDLIIDSFMFNFTDILNPITPLRLNIKNEGVFYEV
jgi:predicted nucleotidyltransferase